MSKSLPCTEILISRGLDEVGHLWARGDGGGVAGSYVDRRRHLERAVVEGRCLGVLSLPVPPQVDLALEGLVAETALEGLVTGVLAHVGYQVTALGERLETHYALVWLFTCNHKREKNVFLVVAFFLGFWVLLVILGIRETDRVRSFHQQS